MKATVSVAAANAAFYFMSAAAVWPFAVAMDGFIEPVMGGIVGALCRCAVEWGRGKLSLRSGLVNFIVGISMSVTLVNLNVPFLGEYLEGPSAIGTRERGFLWGAFGVMVWGLIDDLLGRKRKA